MCVWQIAENEWKDLNLSSAYVYIFLLLNYSRKLLVKVNKASEFDYSEINDGFLETRTLRNLYLNSGILFF